MFSKDINLKSSDIPSGWGIEAADFINKVNNKFKNVYINKIKLLKRKDKERLGKNGIRELIEHAWLKDIPWKELYNKEVNSPYIPKVKLQISQKFFRKKIILILRSEIILILITVIK